MFPRYSNRPWVPVPSVNVAENETNRTRNLVTCWQCMLILRYRPSFLRVSFYPNFSWFSAFMLTILLRIIISHSSSCRWLRFCVAAFGSPENRGSRFCYHCQLRYLSLPSDVIADTWIRIIPIELARILRSDYFEQLVYHLFHRLSPIIDTCLHTLSYQYWRTLFLWFLLSQASVRNFVVWEITESE